MKRLTRREMILMTGGGLVSLLAFPWLRMTMKKRMPVLFLGHGSPMNAIENNGFTQRLSVLAAELPRPVAILCVSAHWLTAGTWVTRMNQPKTIHDFYGFPKELFDVEYPSPGSPEIANLLSSTVQSPRIQGDNDNWGLDHGTWSVLRPMYPRADIPVLQLSIDMSEPPSLHYHLGEQLRFLRDRGVLIIGSGNIVHNLRKIDFQARSTGYDWARDFDEWAKDCLNSRNFKALQNDFHNTQAGRLSVPTLDHYLPLLYVLGASDSKDHLRFEYEGLEMGSISMRCLSLST